MVERRTKIKYACKTKWRKGNGVRNMCGISRVQILTAIDAGNNKNSTIVFSGEADKDKP